MHKLLCGVYSVGSVFVRWDGKGRPIPRTETLNFFARGGLWVSEGKKYKGIFQLKFIQLSFRTPGPPSYQLPDSGGLRG